MNRIESAERALLCAIFRAYPDALVWIGGSVLHLLYSSPRASYDLDLAPAGAKTPSAPELARVIQPALEELNLALGTSFVLEDVPSAALSLQVAEGTVPAFQVDVSAITGHVRETTSVIIQSPLGPQAVLVPTDSGLLRLKLEALLFRRLLKVADVFDVWFLTSRGIRLTAQHRRRLAEEIVLREIEWQEIEQRFDRLTPERFLADLKKRLPAEAYHAWNSATARSAIGAVRTLLRRVWP